MQILVGRECDKSTHNVYVTQPSGHAPLRLVYELVLDIGLGEYDGLSECQ